MRHTEYVTPTVDADWLLLGLWFFLFFYFSTVFGLGSCLCFDLKGCNHGSPYDYHTMRKTSVCKDTLYRDRFVFAAACVLGLIYYCIDCRMFTCRLSAFLCRPSLLVPRPYRRPSASEWPKEKSRESDSRRCHRNNKNSSYSSTQHPLISSSRNPSPQYYTKKKTDRPCSGYQRRGYPDPLHSYGRLPTSRKPVFHQRQHIRQRHPNDRSQFTKLRHSY